MSCEYSHLWISSDYVVESVNDNGICTQTKYSCTFTTERSRKLTVLSLREIWVHLSAFSSRFAFEQRLFPRRKDKRCHHSEEETAPFVCRDEKNAPERSKSCACPCIVSQQSNYFLVLYFSSRFLLLLVHYLSFHHITLVRSHTLYTQQ